MRGNTSSASIIPRCECGSPVALVSTERLDGGSELRVYACPDCKRIMSRKSETAEISRAGADSPAGPACGERKPRARPKRNKLIYKNRWLISQHVVIALRRAGVVCDIVVPDQCANVAGVPAVDLSPRQRRDLALGSDLDAELIEGEAELDIGRSPFKFCQ